MIVVKVRVFSLITAVVSAVLVDGSGARPFFQMFQRNLEEFRPQSPAAAPTSSSESGGSHEVVGLLTQDRCPISLKTDSTATCHDHLLHLNFTACLVTSSTLPKELYLLIQNDGDELLEVNVTILNYFFSFPLLQIPQNQAEKYNISTIVEGNPSIVLNAGSGKCTIHIGSAQSDTKIYKQLSDYASNLRPVHGAYFLFLTALVMGGIWVCCTSGKSDRHVDGVRYQELEMGQAEAESHAASSKDGNNVGTAEGWEEGWDDEWDDRVQVKPSNGHQTQTHQTSEYGWNHGWDN